MRKLWKQVRYRLEYIGLRLLAETIPRLPRRASLALARGLGTLYYLFDHKTRAVALENLRLTLGAALDEIARERVARASFLNFSRAMVDLFWARNLTKENYARWTNPQGFEHAHEVVRKHGSVIFIVLHHGSYEWLSLSFGFAGLPVQIVSLDFKNPRLDDVFREIREHSGHTLIGQNQSMLKLLRAVRKRGGAGMLIDLALKLDRPGVAIDALGMKMYATFLHALLHARTGIPLVPLTNVPHPDGTCTVTAHPPVSFPPGATYQEIAQGCWTLMEPFIREQPELWLWNYRHWRYKPKDAAREYPFYAHVAKKFDQAIAQPVGASGTSDERED